MKVDGVLLVVASGRTRRDDVQRTRELLERAHVRVIGAVLTDAPSGGMRRYY
jgi:Mrp family chromosome partitioning ATPase